MESEEESHGSSVATTAAQNELRAFPLTKSFLELAFEREVEQFTSKLGTNPGDNYLSTIHAVNVKFICEKDVKYYLLKSYPTDERRRTWVDKIQVFEKELFVYQDLIPALHQVITDSGADAETVGLSSAPFHGGNVAVSPSKKWDGSEWAEENFIIMTDLRKYQFGMEDRIQGLDLEHAILVVKEMARWHALAWAYKERSGWPLLSEKYPNLFDRTYSDEGTRIKFKAFFDKLNGHALKVAGESLGEDHPARQGLQKLLDKDVIEIMRRFLEPQGVADEVYEDMLRVKLEEDEEYNKEAWLTGTHGDCWVNNMLFRHDTHDGGPLHVTFIDLQLYREACPTLDLAHFLYSSVRAPVRIPNKYELLLAYHDTVLLSCKELNVKPYPGFSFSSLKRRLRRSELFGLVMAIPELAFALRPAEGEVENSEESKNQSAGSKVAKGLDKNTKFRDELIPTLLDLYENGVI